MGIAKNLSSKFLWLMNNVETKESTVPGCFERELYDELDKCLGKNPCAANEIIFDSGRAGVDKGLFPEIDRPLGDEFPGTPEEEVIKSRTPMESPSMELPTPTPGTCGTAFNDGKFVLVPCEEKPAVHSAPRRKRKRQTPPSVDENDDFKSQLYSMLESSSRVLTAHVESQNLNSQLDRNQRKEHAESLVGVLGKFAEALGKIAERL